MSISVALGSEVKTESMARKRERKTGRGGEVSGERRQQNQMQVYVKVSTFVKTADPS